MHNCFISYSRKDAETAVAIQTALEQTGIPCWIDYRDATVGVDYAGSIVRAIKAAETFVLVLSESSCRSVHVLNEVNSAVNANATILCFKIDDCILTDSLEYYVGRTQWIIAQTPASRQQISKLVDAVLSRKDHPAQARQSPRVNTAARRSGCRMLKYQDLLALGYTTASIALQLVENDYINCNGIGMENEGTAQQWESYLQDNSETFQYLVDENDQIVGDWSIVALNEEAFRCAKAGELLEADIDMDKTELICFPGIYHGYILALSILPAYRNMKSYNLLIDSFLAQLEEYAANGIFFQEWCMNVFSRDVEALVRQLGFKFLANNKVFGKMYGCSFMPLPNYPIYQKHTTLVERYHHATI